MEVLFVDQRNILWKIREKSPPRYLISIFRYTDKYENELQDNL